MKLCSIVYVTLTAVALANSAFATEIKVSVENLKAGQGKLYTSLCSQKHFMNGRCDYEIIRKVAKNTESVIFSEVKPGKYAVSVFYDVNGNEELDTSIFGIPKEPTGVSNNVVGKNGPPAFSDAQIAVEQTPVDITIKVF